MRSWRTPTGPLNDRPSGPSDCEPRKGTWGSPSAGSSPMTSRRCRTSSGSSGCSGRCAIACPKVGPGSRSCCSEPTQLDDRAQAELLLISAVTAVEVGDDDGALAAVEGMRTTRGAHRRSVSRERGCSWPSRGSCRSSMTSMARCEAASTALDGFRRQNEPFMAWAALTVGLLEMTLGRHDAARAHLAEANELGGQFGNQLARVGCTNTARLACREGGSPRRGSSAAGGVGGRERGHASSASRP